MSLVEAGLLLRLLAWAERQSVFWVLHTALNMLLSLLAAAASKVGLRLLTRPVLAQLLGLRCAEPRDPRLSIAACQNSI